MPGTVGKILEVDLARGKTKDLPVKEEQFVKYLGGRGLGARLLFDLLPAKINPLSPENLLIFLTGPLTGNFAPGSSKFVVVTKSPLTHTWCDTYSTGRISIQLKKAGYDGIIVRGKANHPCYLKIDNTGVEIKEADSLWGKDSFETERIIKEREDDSFLAVISIGPAGERLCKFACINSDLYRQAGRGGAGAVMGSKNIKAIVVRGKGGVKVSNRKKAVEMNRINYQRTLKSEVAIARKKYGTPLTLNITNAAGMLPTKNFQFGSWEGALDNIDAMAVERLTISRKDCPSCISPCSLVTRVSEGKYKGITLEGPEYETLGMIGANLFIDSLPVVMQANILCDKLGMDTISTGSVIGFIMECFQSPNSFIFR